jgi:hypothetical protein
MSLALQIERARRLFQSFHRRAPRASEVIEVERPGERLVALEVGILVSVAYQAAGDGKVYEHEFESTRPKLYVTASGKQMLPVGGSYTFTDRGFVG